MASRWVLTGVAAAAVLALAGSAPHDSGAGAAQGSPVVLAALGEPAPAATSAAQSAFVWADPPTHPLKKVAGRPALSRLVTTVEPTDDGPAVATAAWITTSGVPIVGILELQELTDDEWRPIATAITARDGTASIERDPVQTSTAELRFAYPGSARFAPVESEPAVVLGGDVATISVTTCTTVRGLDSLPSGVGCHWAPVAVGDFVVGHDYLGNGRWNTIPLGSYVELDGEFGGLYEVIDRVFAPGRGAALGPATNWICGDECDVVLQTCRGDNTGFTWLRRIASEE